ncbi:hypothetical protein [Idiomarina sp. HP20-50]|uniref:hypothetical protein n=1 Tax=Idiomarina sp. HP20-50 TaxID=3070813 RepID=UPI00294B23ED|nr:hypothetical protein [Idiomarina sp. HP20-50]MDV6316971.1 hypothetical protein [Idiomarina sp. HP20-50]
MSESLDQLLALIKDELDTEQMDQAHVERLFLKLRKRIDEVLSDNESTSEDKGKKLSAVSDVLSRYEKEANQQKAIIQDGLKKLTKGRRSLKEYQDNTG